MSAQNSNQTMVMSDQYIDCQVRQILAILISIVILVAIQLPSWTTYFDRQSVENAENTLAEFYETVSIYALNHEGQIAKTIEQMDIETGPGGVHYDEDYWYGVLRNGVQFTCIAVPLDPDGMHMYVSSVGIGNVLHGQMISDDLVQTVAESKTIY